MKVSYIQNSNSNKYNFPQFKGTVSPEFVQYVNELRQDCLKTDSKRGAEKINKACNHILKKSTEVMEKCFHPLSVLTINKTKFEGYDVIEVKSINAKHFNSLPSACFVPQKERTSSEDRFAFLSEFINSGYVFVEAAIKEITFTAGLGQSLESRDYHGNKEVFDDTVEMLNWWKEHINLLPEDTTGTHGNKDDYTSNCDKFISEITQYIDNLKKHQKKP